MGDSTEVAATDDALVRRMARGDLEALREIYRRLSPAVHGLTRRITGFEEDAEEALVDTFQQAWEQAHLYDPARATVTGWLLNIARSRSIDKLRSRRRWSERNRKLAEVPDLPSGFPTPTPETQVMWTEERRRLREAIDSLPADQKQALELAYFSGLSHSEMAERLGQPLGTVKTRLRLAMKKIRRALHDVDGMER